VIYFRAVERVGGRVLVKDFLSIADLDTPSLLRLLDLAVDFKRRRSQGKRDASLAGKTMALVFQKPSLRTRVSFEVAMSELGGASLYLSPQEVQLGQRESVADVARVLSRYVHCIVARTFSHEDVVELAAAASVPVINGLSDYEHPCQAVADLMTFRERFGSFEGRCLTYVGDGNNVATSLMLAAPLVGLGLRVATPVGFEPGEAVVRLARERARVRGVELRVLNDPYAAARGSDALYTDAWFSMGQESEREQRRPAFARFQINGELLRAASEGAIVLHCLPAHRGEEITDAVLEGPQSAVFDQAENRLHAQKAVLTTLLGEARG
jgi:ornithine carbamoyltransferase